MDSTNSGKYSGFFSKKLKAGKRRTYFFDVRSTKHGDFFLTITESKKKFEGDGYESHKVFLYKEDFKKFLEALNETVDYIKTELMPDYDYNSERPVRQNSFNNSEAPHSESPQETSVEETQNDSSVSSSSSPQISDDEEIDWN